MITAEEARINSNIVNRKKSKEHEILEDIHKRIEKASNDGHDSIGYSFDKKESKDTIQNVGCELRLLGYNIYSVENKITGDIRWLISWY